MERKYAPEGTRSEFAAQSKAAEQAEWNRESVKPAPLEAAPQ